MFEHIVQTGGLNISLNMQQRVKDLILGGSPGYHAKVRVHGYIRSPGSNLYRQPLCALIISCIELVGQYLVVA